MKRIPRLMEHISRYIECVSRDVERFAIDNKSVSTVNEANSDETQFLPGKWRFMSNQTSTTAPATALPDLNKLVAALRVPARWRILKAMTNGEQWMAIEVARVAGCTAAMACKHMAALRAAGLVVQGHAHLYQIPKHLLPTPGAAVVDCGLCLLRLDSI